MPKWAMAGMAPMAATPCAPAPRASPAVVASMPPMEIKDVLLPYTAPPDVPPAPWRMVQEKYPLRYPMHCHNAVHEDHQMMLLFQVQDTGDNRTEP